MRAGMAQLAYRDTTAVYAMFGQSVKRYVLTKNRNLKCIDTKGIRNWETNDNFS